MDVHIEDFQGIKDLDLTIDGFTTLVGRSNIGKSSVHRAIQGLLVNKRGDCFVRKGASNCLVEIDCPELTATWEKGSSKNDYTVDGVELESVGHGPPEQILEAGFRDIEADRTSLSPQIADQFSPLFLLDEKGSVAAEALSDVGRLADVQEALKQVKGDRRENENDLRVRQDDLEDVQTQLTEYDGLEDDMKQLEEAREYHDRIVEIENTIETLESYQDSASELRSSIKDLRGVEDVEVPSFSDDSLFEDVSSLKQWQTRRNSLIVQLKKIQGVDEVDIPSAPDGEMEELLTLMEYEEQLSDIQSSVDAQQSLTDEDIPSEDELRSLSDTVKTLKDLQSKRDRIVSELKATKSEYKEAEGDLEAIRDEIESLFHEAGRCPICEQEYQE